MIAREVNQVKFNFITMRKDREQGNCVDSEMEA